MLSLKGVFTQTHGVPLRSAHSPVVRRHVSIVGLLLLALLFWLTVVFVRFAGTP
jgi:hypothetical protein